MEGGDTGNYGACVSLYLADRQEAHFTLNSQEGVERRINGQQLTHVNSTRCLGGRGGLGYLNRELAVAPQVLGLGFREGVLQPLFHHLREAAGARIIPRAHEPQHWKGKAYHCSTAGLWWWGAVVDSLLLWGLLLLCCWLGSIRHLFPSTLLRG